MILECGRAAVAYIIDLRPSASAQRMHHAPCMHAVAHKPQHTHTYTYTCTYTLTPTPSDEVWPTASSTPTDSFVLTRYTLENLLHPQANKTIMPPKDIPIDPALLESTTDPALTSSDQDDSIRFTPSEEAVGPPYHSSLASQLSSTKKHHSIQGFTPAISLPKTLRKHPILFIALHRRNIQI